MVDFSNIKKTRNAVGFQLPLNSSFHYIVNEENSKWTKKHTKNSRVRDIVRNIEGYCDDDISSSIINVSKSFSPLRKSKFRSAMDLTSVCEDSCFASEKRSEIGHFGRKINHDFEDMQSSKVLSTSISCMLDSAAKKPTRNKSAVDESKRPFFRTDVRSCNELGSKRPAIIIKEVIPAPDEARHSGIQINEHSENRRFRHTGEEDPFDSHVTNPDEIKWDTRHQKEIKSVNVGNVVINNNKFATATGNQERQFLISTDIIKDDRKTNDYDYLDTKERLNIRPNRRLVTLDEILLEKSGGIQKERKKYEIGGLQNTNDMFYMHTNAMRKKKDQPEINVVPETGSTESGYISDNSCLINSQNTMLDAGVLCSPSSTVSLTSDLSTGSNKSTSKKQSSRINSNAPNFAKPTEASLRRSKQSSSPDQSENESVSEYIIQKKFIESLRASEWDLKSATTNSTVEQLPSKTRRNSKPTVEYNCTEPEGYDEQGEYFVLKRWRESLRNFNDKVQERTKKATQPPKRDPTNSNSGSNTINESKNNEQCRDDVIDYVKRREPKYSQEGGKANEGDEVIYRSKVSKAASLESVNYRTKDRCKERFHSVNPATGNFGSSSLKFSTLDTVSEGKILDACTSLPIRPQIRFNNLNRYFSEVNLLQQCKALGQECTRSDNIICNEYKPLRYKRESWARRHGTDDSNNLPDEPVELEPDADPPFERRNVVPRKDCTIDAEYTIVDFLGRGKFGEVKKCIEKKSRKEFAVKLVPVRTEADRREVFNEIEVMNSLQHPRLLQLYDAFEGKKEIALVMELINGGELFERVIDEDFILTERLCELYVEQICEGIAFMHKENFLHLDMKPENILCINRNGHRIKIIDFGLARKFKPGDTLKILFGTPEFVAPEVISYEKIGRGTDMWSIGVICYVLLSGLSPFMGENDVETYNNISRVEYDFEDEAFEEISVEAKDFISKLLVLKKENRMSADECLRHPWLTRHKNVDKSGDEIQINTKKLRRFVIRRRWQKAVNALLALKRMGMTL